jgi:hypothetical protein
MWTIYRESCMTKSDLLVITITNGYRGKGIGMIRRLISIAAAAALMTVSVQAAVLTNVQGIVSVNHGNGYIPAVTGAGIAPGDRVRAGEGSAEIAYENGYVQRIGPGETGVVLTSPPEADNRSNRDLLFLIGAELFIAGGTAAAVATGGGELPSSP